MEIVTIQDHFNEQPKVRIAMFIVWFGGGALLAIIGIICAVGAVLPRDHVATGSVLINDSPAEVWRVIRNVAGAPGWRAVSKVEIHEGPPDAPVSWTETSNHGAMKMRVDRVEEGRILVTRIDDDGLPFGGTWTFELAPEAAGTRVRITERGFVKSPPFRFISKFIMGHAGTLRTYLSELAGKFGTEAKLED